MNLPALNKEVLAIWLRENFKLILAAMNALALLVLLCVVASWLFFEVRTRHLLGQTSDRPRQTLEANPGAGTSPHSAQIKDTDLGADSATTATIAGYENSGSASQNPQGKKSTNPISSAKSRSRRPGGASDGDEEKKRLEQIAQLEKRGLFGEPRSGPQQYNLEGILGDAALINGQWVTVGKQAGEAKVVEIEVSKVVLEDKDGKRRELALLPTEGGGMPPSSISKGLAEVAGRFGLKGLLPPSGSGGFPQIPDSVMEKLTGRGGPLEGMSREELMEQGRRFFSGGPPQIPGSVMEKLIAPGGPLPGMSREELMERSRRFFEEQERQRRERSFPGPPERFEPRPPFPPPRPPEGGPQIPDTVVERLTGPGGRYQGMSREELMERLRRYREEREQRSRMSREEEDQRRREREQEDRRRREIEPREKSRRDDNFRKR